jgi:microcystin-dependent protein
VPREITFVPGTVVSSGFLNDRQDLESALTFIRVELASATAIRVPVVGDGSPSGQTPTIIDGHPRVNGVPFVLPFSSSTQGTQPITFDVYATLQGSAIADGFTLQLVERTGGSPYGGSPGAAPAESRKVAEVDWSGATIVALRNTVEVAGHGWHHRFGGGDPLPAASIDVSMLASTATNKQAFVGDLKLSLQSGDHGPRGDGTFEWVLMSAGRRLRQSQYPSLYSAMGSPALDGLGTYALPPINDRALVAAGTLHPAGSPGWGAESVALAASQIPHHYHSYSGSSRVAAETQEHTHGPGGYGGFVTVDGSLTKAQLWPRDNDPSHTPVILANNVLRTTATTGRSAAHDHFYAWNGNTDGGWSYETGTAINGAAHENRQPSYALNAFVKT